MVFTVLGAVAELERSIIRERVVAGQRAAMRRRREVWAHSGRGCCPGAQAER